jgi:cyclohexyl-isocyanide hydratase
MSDEFLVNMVLVKDMVQLDLTGPFEMLARVPGWKVELVASSLEPVRTDRGLTILPTITRDAARTPDLFVVPGGTGIDTAMVDAQWVRFARDQANAARYVFGICTGSFLLAAAGLLTGRKAGAHWQARDLLARFGAIPCDDRMVVDGKYYTSGGVTSGIDMALRVVGDIAGEETARKIQLQMEYDPAPPFPGGTPFTSSPHIVRAVQELAAQRRAAREKLVDQAAAAMASFGAKAG